MTSDLAAKVCDVLDVDAEEFREQARRDAEVVKAELDEGTFDNYQSIVGLEYEFYAVSDDPRRPGRDGPRYGLVRVPRRLLELIGFEKELGLHNAEMTTSPQPLNADGLRAQEAEVRARLGSALDCTNTEGMRLISDGVWTIPPEGESAASYLADSVDDRGVRIGTNMSDAVRYHTMANGPDAPEHFELDAPHVHLEADTVMPESLITSIQPHYQVAHAADLPQYFNYALRVAGPLLALGANSPVFPPDLYDDAPADEILADGWAEHRVQIFESVLNSSGEEKVAFPRDLDTVEEAVERVVEDAVLVPMPVQRGDRFDDQFATLRLKHGTYWRWVRPVFDGETRSSANARIEFRPLPAQPTVRDSVAFQAVFAGLMESLPKRRHPLIDQDWSTARDNFYTAAREGLDGELRWITNDGQETTGLEEMYDDLFAHAVDGLRSAGCTTEQAERYTEPLLSRVEEACAPADWKRERIQNRLDDGSTLEEAIPEMQREYIDRQSETLLDGSFEDWL